VEQWFGLSLFKHWHQIQGRGIEPGVSCCSTDGTSWRSLNHVHWVFCSKWTKWENEDFFSSFRLLPKSPQHLVLEVLTWVLCQIFGIKRSYFKSIKILVSAFVRWKIVMKHNYENFSLRSYAFQVDCADRSHRQTGRFFDKKTIEYSNFL
jgi:hypothetical protein